jgi:hypothetical protein
MEWVSDLKKICRFCLQISPGILTKSSHSDRHRRILLRQSPSAWLRQYRLRRMESCLQWRQAPADESPQYRSADDCSTEWSAHRHAEIATLCDTVLAAELTTFQDSISRSSTVSKVGRSTKRRANSRSRGSTSFTIPSLRASCVNQLLPRQKKIAAPIGPEDHWPGHMHTDHLPSFAPAPWIQVLPAITASR